MVNLLFLSGFFLGCFAIFMVLKDDGIKKEVETVAKNHVDKELNIKAVVDLNESYSSVQSFIVDGYLIPRVNTPYDCCKYVYNWMLAHGYKKYGMDDWNFVEACLITKTSASKICYGVNIVIEVENCQTYTGDIK